MTACLADGPCFACGFSGVKGSTLRMRSTHRRSLSCCLCPCGIGPGRLLFISWAGITSLPRGSIYSS